MITDPSAILFIWASLMKDVSFFLLKEAHFYLCSLHVTSRCASRGPLRHPMKTLILFQIQRLCFFHSETVAAILVATPMIQTKRDVLRRTAHPPSERLGTLQGRSGAGRKSRYGEFDSPSSRYACVAEAGWMDYPHRHPESVRTSYPTAIRFSVSGGGPMHPCQGTMCWPCPGDDVGNPYSRLLFICSLKISSHRLLTLLQHISIFRSREYLG